MRNSVIAACGLILIGTAPAAMAVPASPAPAAGSASVVQADAVIQVDGWWERDHDENEARMRYWRLQREQLEHYNRIQSQIEQMRQQRHELEQRIERAEWEQRQLLGFQPR